ncbi:hypothetical protein CH372_13785 [Leptospira meyeri]|nr:hypothetical protein CH372_13785 [Leptospira meyeri]
MKRTKSPIELLFPSIFITYLKVKMVKWSLTVIEKMVLSHYLMQKLIAERKRENEIIEENLPPGQE